MINRDDALAKLLQSSAGQLSTKLRLADQENLKQSPVLVVDVGKHAEFFQC